MIKELTDAERRAHNAEELRGVIAYWERRQRQAQREMDSIDRALVRSRAALAKIEVDEPHQRHLGADQAAADAAGR